MKFFLTHLFLTVSALVFSQRGLELNNSGQSKLLGHVDKERLLQAPFDSWFIPNYDTFQIEKSVRRDVIKALHNVDSIKIFFGTWCGDSKREVPRFLKILDEAGYSNVEIIGLDNSFQNYKQSPFGEEKELNIHRVPTFIAYQGSSEMGRIVEHPVNDLALDLVAIADSKSYTPNYEIVHDVHTLIQTKGLDYIISNMDSLSRALKKKAVKVSELSTYASVLFTSFQIPASEVIYDLNSRIFPEDAYSFYGKGRFYYRIGDELKARLAYTQGLLIDPENEGIKKQLELLR